MSERLTVGVIGAGAWGTALAGLAARAGHTVILWARSPELAQGINARRQNPAYLPGVTLPEGIEATADSERLAGAEIFLVATPAQVLGEVMSRFAGILQSGAGVVCAKGIERGSNRLMTEVLSLSCPGPQPFVLSGPSFASDVARGLPTAVTLAGGSMEAARPLAKALSLPEFRIYASDDMTGVQVGGAVKNVLAIACGIASGKKLGESARAALTTRSFAELVRIGGVLGARPETLIGLSCLGDLILTCASPQSRNFSFGRALGEGRKPAEVTAEIRGVVEGIYTASVIAAMAARHGIELPVCEAVHRIVDGQSDPDEEIARLLARPLKAEGE
jgi:glycerol-3-phosphate dehydrogenase (NAD(P)+)